MKGLAEKKNGLFSIVILFFATASNIRKWIWQYI